MCHCEDVLKCSSVGRQLLNIRGTELQVAISDDQGSHCRFDVVAVFHPKPGEREYILRCRHCQDRWSALCTVGKKITCRRLGVHKT